MNRKRTQEAFDVFYTKFKAADVYDYVVKVMESCETVQQLGVAYRWGMTAMEGVYTKMYIYSRSRYGYFSVRGIDLEEYCWDRIRAMEDQIELKYHNLRREIPE